MSPGTFGYPLCFAAFFAVLGLFVKSHAEAPHAPTAELADLDAASLMRRGQSLYKLDCYEEALPCFRMIREKYGTAPESKTAAYAEIVILNKLKDVAQIKSLGDAVLEKYPDDEYAEQVATLLVKSGNWELAGKFYRNLESKYPKSPSLDRFVFFQAVANYQEANFKESIPLFKRFLKSFPNSSHVEKAYYYQAMSYFLSNDYKETLKSIKEYLTHFPNGDHAGDLHYRIAFIDFNDKTLVDGRPIDNTGKIIRDLTAFLLQHPTDASAGSMFCLLADTYKKKNSDKPDELAKYQQLAIDAYKKAVWSDSPNDVIQYALESATSMLQAQRDWASIAALHSEFIKKNPDSPQVLVSIGWIIKGLAREGKIEDAAEIVVNALKSKIGDPSNEQVESLIDELVKTVVPKKKASEVDIDAVDKQLVEILSRAINGQENATTNARIYYARARLAQALKRNDRADLYLNGIAKINSKDLSVLSPALLAASGDILLKLGRLDEAQAMFQRLIDHHKDSEYTHAGKIGLGYIALARNRPADALKIFDEYLKTNPGMFRFKEATLGKLEAMIEIGQLAEAEKLATATVGDRSFRGEVAGKANLLLARLYRKQGELADADAKSELLKKAHAISRRVYAAYKTSPEVCAEGYLQAYLTLIDLGSKENSDETLKEFMGMENLKDTEAYKKVAAIAK